MNVCLIPAAGFGKRVGEPPAKEMLIDPENQKPLIDWSLQLAVDLGLKPVVITRESKTSLISYLEKYWRSRGVAIHLVSHSKEWPDSILQSEVLWGAINLMLLPDTRFKPTSLVEDLIRDCEKNKDASFGYFRTNESLDTWGVLDWRESRTLKICEKPKILSKNFSPQDNIAPWGLISFKKEVGKNLFSDLLKSNQSHEWFDFKNSYSLHELNSFRDITRKSSDLELN